MTKLAFACVGNAGRSQMATAFAERERDRRGLEEEIEIVTGGIDPHDHVHEDVVRVLREEGIDIGNRTPREISQDDVEDADHIITMGCVADEFAPNGWEGNAERWDLDHPGGDDIDEVRSQGDEIAKRVADFFDRVEV